MPRRPRPTHSTGTTSRRSYNGARSLAAASNTVRVLATTPARQSIHARAPRRVHVGPATCHDASAGSFTRRAQHGGFRAGSAQQRLCQPPVARPQHGARAARPPAEQRVGVPRDARRLPRLPRLQPRPSRRCLRHAGAAASSLPRTVLCAAPQGLRCLGLRVLTPHACTRGR